MGTLELQKHKLVKVKMFLRPGEDANFRGEHIFSGCMGDARRWARSRALALLVLQMHTHAHTVLPDSKGLCRWNEKFARGRRLRVHQKARKSKKNQSANLTKL